MHDYLLNAPNNLKTGEAAGLAVKMHGTMQITSRAALLSVKVHGTM